MHWGKELFLQPQSYQIHITKHLVSLGVQVIIGSHPHVLQPHCIQGNKLIAYSLGNFLFPPSRTPGGNNPVRVHPVFLKTKAKTYRTKIGAIWQYFVDVFNEKSLFCLLAQGMVAASLALRHSLAI